MKHWMEFPLYAAGLTVYNGAVERNAKGRIPMRKGHVIYCNRCGRQLKGTDGTPVEEGLHVEKSWGYFSGKDGEIHSFDLCESCYDLLVQDFQIPREKKEQKILI